MLAQPSLFPSILTFSLIPSFILSSDNGVDSKFSRRFIYSLPFAVDAILWPFFSGSE